MPETKKVELGSEFSSSSLLVWSSSLFLFCLLLPHQGNSSQSNLGLYLSRILPQDKNQSSDRENDFITNLSPLEEIQGSQKLVNIF